MKMHDERYVLSIAASHKAVRLRDQQTGEIHEWTGARALYDALGVLAEWRERDNAHKAHYGVPPRCTCVPVLDMKTAEPLHAWSCGLRDKGSEHRSPDDSDRCECVTPSGWTVANIDGSTARRHSPLCPLAAPRNPDYVQDYAVPEIKCPACGVTGGMPHDCETAGRIS